MLLVRNSLFLTSMFDPSSFFIFVDEASHLAPDDIGYNHYEIGVSAGEAANNLAYFGVLAISCSWLKISDAFFCSPRYKYEREVRWFTRFTNVFIPVNTVIIFLTFFITGLDIFLFMSTFSSFFVILLFILGRNQLLKCFREAIGSAESLVKKYRRPLNLIKRSSLIIIIALSCYTLAFTLFAALFVTIGRSVEPGKFQIVYFFRDLAFLAALALVSCNYWYCRTIFQGLRSRSRWEVRNAQNRRNRREVNARGTELSHIRQSTFTVPVVSLSRRQNDG